MISFPMPFSPVPCEIWLATKGPEDDWGNERVAYAKYPDIRTTCCYAPGATAPATSDDVEDGRPRGARAEITFYLPKTVDADLRQALIACYPLDDAALYGWRFRVVGRPVSYPRANTPGDYSWCVEAVTYLG